MSLQERRTHTSGSRGPTHSSGGGTVGRENSGSVWFTRVDGGPGRKDGTGNEFGKREFHWTGSPGRT